MIIAAGNFDGVHRGHAAIMEKASRLGKERGEKTLAFTFSPNPRVFFGTGVELITPDDSEKKRLLLACGADEVVFCPFNSETASLSPREFIELLEKRYGCTAVVCGGNFRFGKDCAGFPSDIPQLSSGRVSVYTAELICTSSGIEISSTAVRDAVTSGDMESAAEMLGRPFTLSGEVCHGRHIGSELGFPTINLSVAPDCVLPANGVYGTLTAVGGRSCYGVTNVGTRPTVSADSGVTVETNLIGIDSELYGQSAEVGFLYRIRDEKKFADTSELGAQIALDKAYVESHM